MTESSFSETFKQFYLQVLRQRMNSFVESPLPKEEIGRQITELALEHGFSFTSKEVDSFLSNPEQFLAETLEGMDELSDSDELNLPELDLIAGGVVRAGSRLISPTSSQISI